MYDSYRKYLYHWIWFNPDTRQNADHLLPLESPKNHEILKYEPENLLCVSIASNLCPVTHSLN